MDNSLEELENELGRLTPRRPSDAFWGRLEQDLAPTPAKEQYTSATSLRSWKWAGWFMAAAAIAAAVFIGSRIGQAPAPAPAPSAPVVAKSETPSPAANRYEPVKAMSVLYDLKEDGVATLPDRTEGRQVRYRYVDTYTWRNPSTNASLRWSVPRDEVRLVKASMN